MPFIASFPNCGYIVHTFSRVELLGIYEEVESIQERFDTAETINHTHTSTLKKEYKLSKSKSNLESLLLPFCKVYLENFDFNCNPNAKFFLETAWVNYQEKREFFSPHTHNGDFSFVIYLKVPFFIEDELKYLSTENKKINTATAFNFIYTDSMGEIKPHTISVDKTWENKMIFFPGKMLHSVQPFYTSNDYRISISGNIKQIL